MTLSTPPMPPSDADRLHIKQSARYRPPLAALAGQNHRSHTVAVDRNLAAYAKKVT